MISVRSFVLFALCHEFTLPEIIDPASHDRCAAEVMIKEGWGRYVNCFLWSIDAVVVQIDLCISHRMLVRCFYIYWYKIIRVLKSPSPVIYRLFFNQFWLSS